MAESQKQKLKNSPQVVWAGMRRDSTRKDNNAAVPSDQSVIEELEWRLFQIH